ncbi:ribosomal protein S18 acetylase RimI-like enzyme [Allocatelliglobosispora scoriae]|uniref:Ribosomal protein S18 acetylase RimI-like enzyme n=1 Tax=Allocatelliglobosispora scoriae TaxID=643052 RepID=A0A841C6I8_9ACTN|nr:GNAT family N-acetyltransferase [Allocatelliglobosispora scoriae]MBB5874550.1 ribosomal protein S18 acetylase RimI-like enzyme [Allocatelliglobosispora scoriae]
MSVTDGRSGPPRLRLAGADDFEQVAALHADSWRRHYRGAFADSYLDGDVLAERRAVWAERLAAPAGTETVLAEQGEERLVGFIHVVFDDDPRWGSFIDNLHVAHDQRRTGIGSLLLGQVARTVAERPTGGGLYLWVLEQNAAAQRFYIAAGATCVETATVAPPGGDPTRLNGHPRKLRMVWAADALV